MLAQGQTGAPIEGLVFRNVTLRITGAENIEGARKITGGRRLTDNVLDLGDKPAAFIFGHINGLVLDGVAVHWPEASPVPPRHAVYGLELDRADLRGLRASASAAALPTVLTERSRDVRQ